MATKQVKLSGQCYWAKLIQPDTKYGSKWTLNLYMDKASKKIFEEAGIQKKVNKDALGEFVRLDRKTEQLITGKSVEFKAPKVTYHDKEFNELVGNGSSVECIVSVYDTAYGPGTRLESVVVVDLVPFVDKTGADVDLS